MVPNDFETETPPVALTVAGFDPSGGAGVVADVKTFTAFGCFATAAVTSLTFQNTVGVFGAAHQSAEVVRAQVLAVAEDFPVAGAKTGMLPTRETVVEVARLFRETDLPAPVVDPVVRSTTGHELMDDAALDALKRELLPLARVVTPNIPEAERLTGLKVRDERGAARVRLGVRVRALLQQGGGRGRVALARGFEQAVVPGGARPVMDGGRLRLRGRDRLLLLRLDGEHADAARQVALRRRGRGGGEAQEGGERRRSQ